MHIYALAPLPHRISSAGTISSRALLLFNKELMLQLLYHGKINTNLCLFFTVRAFLSLDHLFPGCLRLRKVYEERLLVFALLLPLVKTISQDDAALSFNHRILQVNHKMLKRSWSSSIVNKTVAEKGNAPCMSSLTAYSHCGSCWCCNASCLGHFP